jgi:hypothetical protein
MTKKHNTLAIRPAICSGTDIIRDDNTFYFWVKNKGHGTARIEGFNLSIESKLVTVDDFEKDFTQETSKFGKYTINYGSQKSGSYLEKGETIDIVKVTFENKLSDKFIEHIQKRYNLEIKYSSLYGEKLVSFNTKDFR